MRPSGEVRWCYGAGIISRDAAGKAVRMNGVTVDITDRKRAEERQVLLERAQESALGVWDGAVAEANRRRLMVVTQVESMQREASRIAEQLGDVHDDVCWRTVDCIPLSCLGKLQ